MRIARSASVTCNADEGTGADQCVRSDPRADSISAPGSSTKLVIPGAALSGPADEPVPNPTNGTHVCCAAAVIVSPAVRMTTRAMQREWILMSAYLEPLFPASV